MTLTIDDVKKLKVQELRDELQSRGLDTSGLKAVLIERLEEAIKNGTLAAGPTPSEVVTLQNASNEAAEAPSKDNEAPAEAASQPGKIVFENSAAAELEKRKARAARFGVPLNLSEDKRKELRAQRFGLADTVGTKGKASEPIAGKREAPAEELAAQLEKKKARAARFDVPLVTTSKEEQLRLKARAERFKDQLADIPASKADPTKDASKNAAAAEFNAKKKARAERFKVAA